MKEDVLNWMNRKYSGGFYCADIRKNKTLSGISFSALNTLNTPLLFHLEGSQLQDLIGRLIEYGVSAYTPCHLPENEISGTLGDIALRTRSLNLDSLFLVIAE
jgi:siroheme synthase